MLLWHNTCSPTTGITRVVSEERQKGKAIFRMLEYGSVDHLRYAKQPISKCGICCECYEDDDRH